MLFFFFFFNTVIRIKVDKKKIEWKISTIWEEVLFLKRKAKPFSVYNKFSLVIRVANLLVLPGLCLTE